MNLFAEWVQYKAIVKNRAELITLYNYIVDKYQSLKVPGLILISSAFDEYGLGVQYALLNGDTPYFAFTNFFLTLYANPQYSIINQLTPGSDDYKQSVAIYNAWLSWLKKVQELKANGKLKGVIIDLRSNGGGMFYDFGLVLGSLFQPGTDLQVGYHRYKRGPGRYDYSPLMPDTRPGIDIVELLPNEPSVQNIQQQGITEPIVVLTNCMSVSMAEMTAMGAKAMPNARVIGKRTFGGLCGLVGNESASYNYSGHIGIMGKTAVYCYTPTVATIQPDGKTILEGIGVTPDIEVKEPESRQSLLLAVPLLQRPCMIRMIIVSFSFFKVLMITEIPFRVVAIEVVFSQRRGRVACRIDAILGVLTLLTRDNVRHDAIRTIGQLLNTPELLVKFGILLGGQLEVGSSCQSTVGACDTDGEERSGNGALIRGFQFPLLPRTEHIVAAANGNVASGP